MTFLHIPGADAHLAAVGVSKADRRAVGTLILANWAVALIGGFLAGRLRLRVSVSTRAALGGAVLRTAIGLRWLVSGNKVYSRAILLAAGIAAKLAHRTVSKLR